MKRLRKLVCGGIVSLIFAGVAMPAAAYRCTVLSGGDWYRMTMSERTEYRDTTLYKRWRENEGLSEFTGDFTDVENDPEHEIAKQFWIQNNKEDNQIDSVKFWLKDADGNLLAEVNRGINIKYFDAAKFQIPWRDGYQLNMRITWVKYGAKKTWEDVWDGTDKGGYSVWYHTGDYIKAQMRDCK